MLHLKYFINLRRNIMTNVFDKTRDIGNFDVRNKRSTTVNIYTKLKRQNGNLSVANVTNITRKASGSTKIVDRIIIPTAGNEDALANASKDDSKKTSSAVSEDNVKGLPGSDKVEVTKEFLRPHNTSVGVRRNTKLIRPHSMFSRTFSSSSPASSGPCTSLADIAQYVLGKRATNIVIMAGAGISTSSGIPDFRTPGSGLYDNLNQYRIPYPEAIFDIDYFHFNPKPFFTLAKELYPSGQYRPNLAHYFFRLLHDKGLLLRVYTQNIDGLERLAGLPPDKLVEAHGTFATATCTECHRSFRGRDIKPAIDRNELPQCASCDGIIKPDIVFFGEDLPRRFWSYLRDFAQADLVVVMGTSLEVEPFASIVDSSRPIVPRVLFNRELVGVFKRKRRLSDVSVLGELTEGIIKFADLLNWRTELEDLMKKSEEEKFNFIDPESSSGASGNNNGTGVRSGSGRPPPRPNAGTKTDGAPSGNGARRHLSTMSARPLPPLATATRSRPPITLRPIRGGGGLRGVAAANGSYPAMVRHQRLLRQGGTVEPEENSGDSTSSPGDSGTSSPSSDSSSESSAGEE